MWVPNLVFEERDVFYRPSLRITASPSCPTHRQQQLLPVGRLGHYPSGSPTVSLSSLDSRLSCQRPCYLAISTSLTLPLYMLLYMGPADHIILILNQRYTPQTSSKIFCSSWLVWGVSMDPGIVNILWHACGHRSTSLYLCSCQFIGLAVGWYSCLYSNSQVPSIVLLLLLLSAL